MTVPVSLSFDADFHDMFEVRGASRAARGTLSRPMLEAQRVTLSYRGLDDLRRDAVVAFSIPPEHLQAKRADFTIALAADAAVQLFVEVAPDSPALPDAQRFQRAAVAARLAMREHREESASLHSGNAAFNEWVERSRADLALLTSSLPTGPYPYAGIPWFSTPFGRDGIVTAMEALWLDPRLAQGVLRYLASRQATETSAFQDAAPGKIMHETRKGEMCATRELPFGLYYGGVDTTPMFVMLAGMYADRTGDLGLIDELWPALCKATQWVEDVRARSPNNLLDYERGESSGLANQGWKDSEDSVFHADGSFPKGPIALIEVQGFAFRAFATMSNLATRRGETRQASHWAACAEAVREAVERKFWIPEKGFYGIAIDGDGRLCETLASNAGQLLFSGLAAPERAGRVIERLLSTSFRSGWGLRTLALGQARFNPMSYHNGSVWPHDTALSMLGMRRHGELDGPVELLGELCDAASYFGMRLPELFCGFARSPGQPPIGYPVACLPQAWSAGSTLMMLQACLGVTIDGWQQTVQVDRPRLPAKVSNLSIGRLQIGPHRVSLRFERVNGEVLTYVDGTPEAVARVSGPSVRRGI
jgi:glycogen debranching enzyme